MATSFTKFYIDLESLLENANDPAYFIRLLSDLTFKRVGNTYRCKESSGLTIFKHKSGKWLIKNHSQKLDVPDGDLFKLVKHVYNLDTSAQDGFIEACRIIADISNQYLEVDDTGAKYVPPVRPVISSPKVEEFTPNKGQELNQSADYSFADTPGSIWSSVCDYFDRFGVSAETLNRYDIRPLQSVRFKKNNGSTISFTPEDFAFAYMPDGESGTIKYKRPNAVNGGKELYIQNSGNYVFGFNQLPDHCDTILIAAGEKDTIVLNHHLNQSGIYTVCLSSETASLNESFICELRNRCDRLFTIFDNDETGRKQMMSHASNHAIPFIDIGYHVNEKDHFWNITQVDTSLNDVSDIAENDIDLLRYIITFEIATKAAISKDKSDPFDISIPDCRVIYCDQYIGENEPFGLLQHMMANHRKILLNAPTGSGKSWSIINLCSSKIFRQMKEIEGVKHIVMVVPSTALAEQFAKDYKSKTGKDAPIIQNGFHDFDAMLQDPPDLIVTTYHSAPKIAAVISESLVVIDEVHELRNRGSIMRNENALVWEIMNEAHRVLAISATPLRELTTGAISGMDFQTVIVRPNNLQHVDIQPVLYTEGSEIDVMKHSQEITYKDGVKVFRMNDVGSLEAMREAAGSGCSTIISSKDKKYKEGNRHYQSIMDHGGIDPEIRNLFCTSLLDAGTSFKFQVASTTMVNERCHDSITQHIARPRLDNTTGLNKSLHALMYHKVDKREIERFRLGFNTAHSGSHDDDECTIVRMQYSYQSAEKTAAEANKHYSKVAETQRKYFDDHEEIYYSELYGKWMVNVPAIMYREYERMKSTTTLEKLYRRLENSVASAVILQPIVAELERDEKARELIESRREIRKEMKLKANDLIVKNTRESLEAHAHITGNLRQRKEIKSVIHVGKEMTQAAEAIYSQHSDIFDSEAMSEPIGKYLRCKALKIPSLDSSAISTMISMSGQEFKRTHDTLLVQQEMNLMKSNPELLSGKAAVRSKESDRIMQAIRKTKQATKKAHHKGHSLPKNVIAYESGTLTVSAKFFVDMHREVTGRKSTRFDTIKMRFIELYDVQRVRQGVYTIGKRKTIRNVIEGLKSVTRSDQNEYANRSLHLEPSG